MRTYDSMTVYKVCNDLDDNTFFGFTSSSVSSRMATLRRELLDPRYTSELHKHMRSLGKDHSKIMFVEAVANCTIDEDKERIAESKANEQKPKPKRVRTNIEELLRGVGNTLKFETRAEFYDKLRKITDEIGHPFFQAEDLHRCTRHSCFLFKRYLLRSGLPSDRSLPTSARRRQ